MIVCWHTEGQKEGITKYRITFCDSTKNDSFLDTVLVSSRREVNLQLLQVYPFFDAGFVIMLLIWHC